MKMKKGDKKITVVEKEIFDLHCRGGCINKLVENGVVLH